MPCTSWSTIRHTPPELAAVAKLLTALVAVATLGYPLAVYLGLHHFGPGWLALGLMALAAARAWVTRQPVWLAAAAGAAMLGAASWLGNAWMPLKLYPALVNAALLCVFAASLIQPPSMIERLARLADPALPPAAVAYTRRVTAVWCLFFAGNGAVALATALWGSDELWALYNGLIAYGLMGLLFSLEWLVRQRVKARLLHG
jgi:uncharacterized membrane protein